MKRRDWMLAALGGAGALTLLGLRELTGPPPIPEPGSFAGEGPRPVPPNPLGVQLYTLRELLDRDVEATLRAVAEIGYREVELAGLHGLDAAGMRRRLDDSGLSAPSGHVDLGALRNEPDRVLADASTLGHRYVVVAWLPSGERTAAGYRRLADDLDAAGARARAAGLTVGYHNHDYEMEAVEGRRAWDLLIERTDPDLVTLQMDVFWTVHGGADPLAYLRAHPGRFTSIHAKDRTADGEMAAVGEGVIDFASILAEARAGGLRHVFVEHDRPRDPLASIRTSFDTLATLEA